MVDSGEDAFRIKVEYISCGQGNHTLLFLPGILGKPDMWFHAVQAFEGQYKIISMGYPQPYRPTDKGIDCVRVVLKAEDVEKATFIGYSGGALTIQLFILRHPEYIENYVMTNVPPINAAWGKQIRLGTILYKMLSFPLYILHYAPSLRRHTYS